MAETHNNMNVSQQHCARWRKPDTEHCIMYASVYMKFFKKAKL